MTRVRRVHAAVILDMDGVIIDSEPLHKKAYETLFSELGRERDHGVVFSEYHGRSDKALRRDLIDRHGLPNRLEDLLERKQEYFLQYLRHHRPVFQELHGLIPSLAEHYKLAVASSNFRGVIDVVMDFSGLRSCFDALVGSEDVRQLKPDPEIFLTAAARLGVQPSDCCVVEDSVAGIQAAKRAGMTAIGFTTSLPREHFHEADYVADTWAEIRGLLLDANGVPVTAPS